jgi:hypothetical protein
VFCLFFGPIGLLSHLLTSAIADRLGKTNQANPAEG